MVQLEDEFCDIVGKARRGLGLSDADLQKATGLDVQRYRLLLDGDAQPTDSETDALAKALSLRSDALRDIVNGWTPEPVEFASFDESIIKKIEVPYGSYSSNAYMLGCTATRLAAIIDPGGAIENILSLLKKHDLEPVMALITHSHGDHIGGLNDLLSKTNIKHVVCHIDERVPTANEAKTDGEEFLLGKIGIKLIHTPGHTQGSACYFTGRVCFTGDTMFSGSLGGAASSIYTYRNILTSGATLIKLPDETILLPGHGPATTIKEEKLHNPFVTN